MHRAYHTFIDRPCGVSVRILHGWFLFVSFFFLRLPRLTSTIYHIHLSIPGYVCIPYLKWVREVHVGKVFLIDNNMHARRQCILCTPPPSFHKSPTRLTPSNFFFLVLFYVSLPTPPYRLGTSRAK